MKKRSKLKLKDFDETFDQGDLAIDFSSGVLTEGLSKVVKFPPFTIPAWLNVELESLAQLQANSKSAVVRQLLVEAIMARRRGPTMVQKLL